jgi:hypothetical protein
VQCSQNRKRRERKRAPDQHVDLLRRVRVKNAKNNDFFQHACVFIDGGSCGKLSSLTAVVGPRQQTHEKVTVGCVSAQLLSTTALSSLNKRTIIMLWWHSIAQMPENIHQVGSCLITL